MKPGSNYGKNTKGNPDDSRDYSQLSRAFKANPTIEQYVALRRQNPDAKIEVAISSGLEWLFVNEETLKTVNINPELIDGILDADQVAISELSLLLLERIIERRKLQKSGQTHLARRKKAISDGLINFLINLMLGELPVWDEAAIKKRGEELFVKALKIWPRPTAS